jgi:hypothetical protein
MLLQKKKKFILFKRISCRYFFVSVNRNNKLFFKIEIMTDEDVQALVVDNGSGMCKVKLFHIII